MNALKRSCIRDRWTHVGHLGDRWWGGGDDVSDTFGVWEKPLNFLIFLIFLLNNVFFWPLFNNNGVCTALRVPANTLSNLLCGALRPLQGYRRLPLWLMAARPGPWVPVLSWHVLRDAITFPFRKKGFYGAPSTLRVHMQVDFNSLIKWLVKDILYFFILLQHFGPLWRSIT